jgi:hypothetical protein
MRTKELRDPRRSPALVRRRAVPLPVAVAVGQIEVEHGQGVRLAVVPLHRVAAHEALHRCDPRRCRVQRHEGVAKARGPRRRGDPRHDRVRQPVVPVDPLEVAAAHLHGHEEAVIFRAGALPGGEEDGGLGHLRVAIAAVSELP